MSTTTRKRRLVPATKPATGTTRWLLRPVWPKSGAGACKPGVLAINGTEYEVLPLGLGGFRLTKPDGTVYDVNTTDDPWTCDCPDATFHPERPGGCKHVAALRSALPRLFGQLEGKAS